MFQIHTSAVQLSFDETAGKIVSLIGNGRQYIAHPVSVFRLALRNKDALQTVLETDSLPLKEFSSCSNGFTAVYSCEKATVTVSLSGTQPLNWRVAVAPAADLVAEWVNFPQMIVPDDLRGNKDSSSILWGFNEGSVVNDMNLRENGFCYLEPEYPGMGVMGMYPAIVETQLMAYFKEEKGLYLAAHDKDDCLKGIDFYRAEGGILLQFRHFCGVNFGETYEMPFDMVMQFYEGPWQSAAEIYRTWLDSVKTFLPIEKNPAIPAWYGDSPVVVTYPVRGVHDMDIMEPNKLYPYINAMPHIERLEKTLGSKILVLLMHWEGSAPWAPPIVWPPFGGEDELKKFIDALHRRGDVLGVYCSGMGWSEQSNLIASYNTEKQIEEEHLKDYFCASPEQTVPHSKICTGQRSGYDLCPTQDFTVKTLRHEVEQMTSAGIDYIQLMDQNHGGTSYFCYSKSHGHPPVPGKWQVDAVKSLLSKVTADTGHVLFGCESAAAEAYLPQLLFSDNRFNLNYHIGYPVPLYGYLYHQYLNNFMGNQVCSMSFIDDHKTPYSLLERTAYSFIAGDILTVVMDQDGMVNWCWGQREMEFHPDQESFYTLVRNLNGWRQGAGKKYLHTGRMVAPWAVHCGTHPLYRTGGTVLNAPAIHTSAWQASDGTVGQILVNYREKEESLEIDLPEGAYNLINQDGTQLGVPAGKRPFTVPPLSAVLIIKIA